jgi:hypothetical protein
MSLEIVPNALLAFALVLDGSTERLLSMSLAVGADVYQTSTAVGVPTASETTLESCEEVSTHLAVCLVSCGLWLTFTNTRM